MTRNRIAGIIIDNREPVWVQGLRFDGAPVSIEQIDADALILLEDGTMLGIERKTAEDFLGTLRANRLWPQLARLRELTPWAYLVMTGDLRAGPGGKCVTDEGRETGWNYGSVQGALLTVQEIGVHVVTCRELDYETTILRLAARDRSAIRVQPARDTLLMSEGEQILSALPGIGEDKANRLIEHCGSAAWALTYLCLMGAQGIPGIGDGIRRRVRKALGLDDWQILHVVDAAGADYVRGAPFEPGAD